jgi:polyferredoxin
MDSINKPRGLIRIDSEENIEHAKKNKFNWRLGAYSTILALLVAFLAYLLLSRNDVDATILRTQGQIFQTQPDGRISNMFTVKLANKTRRDIPMTLKLENVKGEITIIGNNLTVPAESYFQSPFFVKMDKVEINKRKTKLLIGVYEGNKKIETAETTFLGPAD